MGDAQLMCGVPQFPLMSSQRHFVLRMYEPRDREAVRQICCDTADCGEPVERFFPDREVFADLLTRYYTDFEPQSAIVAVSEGRVVGYVIGCYNTARFHRIMIGRIVPLALLKALCRGTFRHPQARALVRANCTLWRQKGLANKIPLHEYPAHLHINLRSSHRGLHIGQHILEQWLNCARGAGVRGVHAGVNARNTAACIFFETMGFQSLGRQPYMRLPGEDQVMERVLYGLQLNVVAS